MTWHCVYLKLKLLWKCLGQGQNEFNISVCKFYTKMTSDIPHFVYIQAIEFFWICKSNFHNKSGKRIIAQVQSNQKLNFQYPAIVWHEIKHFNRMANECCWMFMLIFCFDDKHFFGVFVHFNILLIWTAYFQTHLFIDEMFSKRSVISCAMITTAWCIEFQSKLLFKKLHVMVVNISILSCQTMSFANDILFYLFLSFFQCYKKSNQLLITHDNYNKSDITSACSFLILFLFLTDRSQMK